MPSGVYDRTKSKPNSGVFKKGEHRNPDTEFKKGVLVPSQFKKGEQRFPMPHGHGHFHEPEYIKKQSDTHKGQHSSPKTEFKKGEHPSPNTEFKPLVPGGISSEEIKFRNSPLYREWRKNVFERDNYTCQRCGVRGGRLTAHHIKFFVTYPELRIVLDNGITYCKPCHSFEHARLKILATLLVETQENRRQLLLLRLDTLEKYNTIELIRGRGTFQSYSINPLTRQPLPKKKSRKQIIKDIQLSFEEVMSDVKECN